MDVDFVDFEALAVDAALVDFEGLGFAVVLGGVALVDLGGAAFVVFAGLGLAVVFGGAALVVFGLLALVVFGLGTATFGGLVALALRT